jgi:hypothetical protein
MPAFYPQRLEPRAGLLALPWDFSPRFRAPIRDQLVNQAVVGSDLGKQTAHPHRSRAPPLLSPGR